MGQIYLKLYQRLFNDNFEKKDNNNINNAIRIGTGSKSDKKPRGIGIKYTNLILTG